MTRACAAVLMLLTCAMSRADVAKYSIKTMEAPAPKELHEAFAKLLSDQAVQFLDQKGEAIAEWWFRKEVPAKATPVQIKNGLTYREVEETAFLGVTRFLQPITDYRGQKIKPGLYTLRLGFIKMDGDHMGVSLYSEFGLLTPADKDEKPDTLKDAKSLHDLAKLSTDTSHPAVLLLFPNSKPEAEPKLHNKGGGHWVLFVKTKAAVDGHKPPLGIALTLIGQAAE